MNIIIKKNSTLPEIRFSITQKIKEKFDISNEMLENVGVTFSMTNENGLYRIANKEATLRIVEDGESELFDNSIYELSYRFTTKETSKSGRFYGEFKLDFLDEDNCGKITFPTDDYINIIISDSITKTNVI